MTEETEPRGAVMQFEIDRKRWAGSEFVFVSNVNDSPERRLRNLIKTAAADTLENGGTFVLVVTPDKITMVQRPDAEEL